MAGAMLSTAAEVAAAIEAGDGLAGWKVLDRGAHHLELGHEPNRFLLVWPTIWRDPAAFAPHLLRVRSGAHALALLGSAGELGEGRVGEVVGEHTRANLIPVPVAPGALAVLLRGWGDGERLLREMADIELELDRARHENGLLIDIGRALSRERDLPTLFELILKRAREVTGADAGSIYVVEGEAEDLAERTLRFVESQNDSISVGSEGFTLKVSPSSIVGACVLAGEVINIPDLYGLDTPGTGNNPWGFVHDRSFDKKHGYQTRSMVTVPMISARNQVIGVIQLINKRSRAVTQLRAPADFQKVLPFDAVSINYATTLASQAGIALENAMLYAEVRTLFEGFVKASVTAIEARDPTTSGHSERVATLTVELAKVADRADSGSYKDLKVGSDDLKQIEFAALLHDFGKVGVRENVLVKAMKLYEHDRALIESRFDFIRKSLEAERSERKVRYLMEASRAEVAAQLAAADADAHAKLEELDTLVAFILQANQPTVLEQGGFEKITEIALRQFTGTDGKSRPYLTAEEAKALQIARGSLTNEERLEIESHVVHTYNFLREIPWGRAFKQVPGIAGAHHEKLDGTGYPHGLKAADIPAPAKMMTISDIYDALTASDRPYKRAVPVPKALDILKSEVDRNKLDRELFDMFVGAKVWERLGQQA